MRLLRLLYLIRPTVYQHLPSHNGLRLQMRVYLFDGWPDYADVLVYVDGRLVYQTEKKNNGGKTRQMGVWAWVDDGLVAFGWCDLQ